MVRFVVPLVLVQATLFETFTLPDAPVDGLWWASGLVLVVALFLQHRRPAPALALAAFASFVHMAAHLTTLEQRAADLERERSQREALAAAAERSRIGREMHDVVAHRLSVIVMQVQGGAAMLSQSPDQAAEALEHIIVTGRADHRRPVRLQALRDRVQAVILAYECGLVWLLPCGVIATTGVRGGRAQKPERRAAWP